MKLIKKPNRTSLPAGGGSSPSPVKSKHIGRPKGSKNKKKGVDASTEVSPKALTVLQGVVADTEKLDQLAGAEVDGGGTHENSPTITKESLERRISRRLNVLDRYLTDDRLHQLLTQSSLKEIGIYEGIMMDKSLVLKGQPTVIIGNSDRAEIGTMLPRLLSELKRRGMVATATERTVEFRGTHEPESGD